MVAVHPRCRADPRTLYQYNDGHLVSLGSEVETVQRLYHPGMRGLLTDASTFPA